MFWERNKGLIIIGLIWIVVSIPILIMLCLEVGEKIQAEAIITLVFITMFYAIQTRNLVKQAEISFNDQVQKRNVDFEERKLREFYNPFKYLILDLKDKVKNEAKPSKSILDLSIKIAKLGASSGHLITQELEDKAVDLLNSLFEIERVNVEDEKQLNLWKEDILGKIEKVLELRKKEVDVINNIIKETYVLFSEKFKEVLAREEESES